MHKSLRILATLLSTVDVDLESFQPNGVEWRRFQTVRVAHFVLTDMPRDLQRGGPLILLLKHGIYGMDIWNRRRNMYLSIHISPLYSSFFVPNKTTPPK